MRKLLDGLFGMCVEENFHAFAHGVSACPDCPDGTNPAVTGISTDDNWAPIADRKNDYVQIGRLRSI